jgi:tRNA-Thr(GGU) m(6)t(6)A37 methyltransferase TsaA
METVELKLIARIESAFQEKFGIPRQSGLAPSLTARIVFEPEFRNPDALRGIEGFSHLWLIWQFSKAVRADWSPTVRPPRLGGNTRVGVFASRSPFRPNAIGLSCVKLEAVERDPVCGPVLIVSGADLLDGTPIFDIKPYLPYADSVPQAVGGFAPSAPAPSLTVEAGDGVLSPLPERLQTALLDVLALDPRPSYQDDPDRVYGMRFAGFEVRFRVAGHTLRVLSVSRAD